MENLCSPTRKGGRMAVQSIILKGGGIERLSAGLCQSAPSKDMATTGLNQELNQPPFLVMIGKLATVMDKKNILKNKIEEVETSFCQISLSRAFLRGL